MDKPNSDETRSTLRHIVATLAYRSAKVLRGIPDNFPEFVSGPSTRKPVLILAHMADLMGWAVRMARGEYRWEAAGTSDWKTESDRFFNSLQILDAVLASDEFAGSPQKLIQGPLADALTHVGQLA